MNLGRSNNTEARSNRSKRSIASLRLRCAQGERSVQNVTTPRISSNRSNGSKRYGIKAIQEKTTSAEHFHVTGIPEIRERSWLAGLTPILRGAEVFDSVAREAIAIIEESRQEQAGSAEGAADAALVPT